MLRAKQFNKPQYLVLFFFLHVTLPFNSIHHFFDDGHHYVFFLSTGLLELSEASLELVECIA